MVAIIQAWRPGCKVAQALFVWRACVCCLLVDADVFVRVSAAQLCREHPYDTANQLRTVWAVGWASVPPTQSALSHGRRDLLLPLVACALASGLAMRWGGCARSAASPSYVGRWLATATVASSAGWLVEGRALIASGRLVHTVGHRDRAA